MKERPILFSAPMVRAILDGRKTQTRRIITPQPSGGVRATRVAVGASLELSDAHGRPIRIPFYPGNLLWVRETWAVQHALDPQKPSEMRPQDARLHYYATESGLGGALKRSPLFMPRWASRITLRVTDVRVQRLQEISEEDARAEGLHWWSKDGELRKWGLAERHRSGELDHQEPWADMARSHTEAFKRLWDAINHKRMPWASNPWVWAIGFERVS